MSHGPNGLEVVSRLDRSSIEANYRDMYPRFDYNKASERAVLAWDARVKRCVLHLQAGWDEYDARAFVYCEDEWREALGKVGRTANTSYAQPVDNPTPRTYTNGEFDF